MKKKKKKKEGLWSVLREFRARVNTSIKLEVSKTISNWNSILLLLELRNIVFHSADLDALHINSW